jgi:membrane fusion protein (multidrug efflux system)
MISIAGLNQPFAGKVYAIEPRIDSATRTLRLRARADNPGGRALPGGFATVEMGLEEIPRALLVPATALVAGLNEQQVYVIEEGKAQPRKVQIGLRLAREVQIVSGLEPNAVVITSGQLQLRPGVSVEPTAAPGSMEAAPARSAGGKTAPGLRADAAKGATVTVAP